MPLPSLPPDHHVHTLLCGHATGTPEEYAEAAFLRGIPALAITDHIPAPDGYDPETRMRMEDFARYDAAVRKAQARWPGRIRFGIEADFYAGCESWLNTFLQTHPFDVVLGAVHFIGAWGFDNPAQIGGWQERPLDRIWSDYFDQVRRLAETGLFDVIAHIDLPKKFGHRLPASRLLELAEPALQAIAARGLVLEINTGGLRKPVGEIYPSPALLRRACELGIPILFGSDAHRPEDVGAGFTEAVRLAWACGYSQHVIVEQRRLRWESLPPAPPATA